MKPFIDIGDGKGTRLRVDCIESYRPTKRGETIIVTTSGHAHRSGTPTTQFEAHILEATTAGLDE